MMTTKVSRLSLSSQPLWAGVLFICLLFVVQLETCKSSSVIAGECLPSNSDLSSYYCLPGISRSTKQRRTSSRNETTTSQKNIVDNHPASSKAKRAATSGIACTDGHVECPNWAARRECAVNPGYMLTNCRKSCNTCVDLHVGVLQIVPEEEIIARGKQVHDHLQSTQAYIYRELAAGGARVDTCRNEHALCTLWAVQGKCEEHAGESEFMWKSCAPACQTCHLAATSNT